MTTVWRQSVYKTYLVGSIIDLSLQDFDLLLKIKKNVFLVVIMGKILYFQIFTEFGDKFNLNDKPGFHVL